MFYFSNSRSMWYKHDSNEVPGPHLSNLPQRSPGLTTEIPSDHRKLYPWEPVAIPRAMGIYVEPCGPPWIPMDLWRFPDFSQDLYPISREPVGIWESDGNFSRSFSLDLQGSLVMSLQIFGDRNLGHKKLLKRKTERKKTMAFTDSNYEKKHDLMSQSFALCEPPEM